MQQVIEVKNVWKKYKIGQPKSLTTAIPSFFFRKTQGEFWALKNIALKVKKGERIGVVGPNGSGKSTLLKILSGVSFPTRGNLTIIGKCASLLELGTGFHPDLTGRENIYLYGAILGVKKKEIDEIFEQIVSFSGIKKFLETPVKHYSSGMYIRLAFSVAIHFDWDILIIDEVLTVGDEEFQKKSSSKLEDFIKRGKTFILVSHNLEMIKKLCTRAILLEKGQIKKTGNPDSVINYYISHTPV